VANLDVVDLVGGYWRDCELRPPISDILLLNNFSVSRVRAYGVATH
jgi:hypothetical protein